MSNKLLLMAVLFIVFAGCDAGSSLSASKQPGISIEKKSLDTVTTVTEQELDIASNIINDFTFNMHRDRSASIDNTFLDGYSFFSMYNMLMLGARGDTQQEMLSVANIDISLPMWERYTRALNKEIIEFTDDNNSGYRFVFVNSLWVQEGEDIDKEYHDALKSLYGIDLHYVDFESDSETARMTINNSVSQLTEGAIPDMMPKDSLSSSSKIVMVNALYLKALWERSFHHDDTKLRDFSLVDGSVVSVPMMHQVNSFRYVHKDGYEVVCMHYKDSDFGLVSFMPKEGEFHNFESNLSNTLLDYLADDFAYKKLDLYYPKLHIESDISNLKEMLITEGVKKAFTQDADFSGMGENLQLHISNISQKVHFHVDEEGTEIASATAISLGETDAQKAITVKFNRPFIVMICHIPTRTVLFMGRVLNPLS